MNKIIFLTLDQVLLMQAEIVSHTAVRTAFVTKARLSPPSHSRA